jgi:hypothetical protein
MAKKKIKRKKAPKRAKTKHRRKKKPKTLLEKIKHWLEKRGQGLPMTTIVIIIIVIIVLAVVILFFFGQFSAGKTTAEAQQNVSLGATQVAKCNAWAAGILPTNPCGKTASEGCPKQALCTYIDRNPGASFTDCYCTDCSTVGKGGFDKATDC